MPNSSPNEPNGSRAKDVLLIEDEGEMCLLLNVILNNKNLRIMHVKTLGEAALFLQKHQPDLILLDNRLPDGYGFDFIEFVKSNCPTTKIILITGVDRAAGDFAMEIGADLFLPKPFTKDALLQSVSKLLN